ncbi:hypothetical protein TEA_026921 [Camellia sinensis var. sinensis]|uniref:Cullin N-terminal domain-containing protein n=1 Tax=Camellia sinensis var. sinensis TaxID=542762 RepID=A0A4S4E1K6_CAMSN|nr:hypothetical protein TEA_026921 [Camellia sinensis var. sinensis]
MAKEGEASCKTIPFEEGWPVLQDAINKLIDSLEGVCPHTFTPEEGVWDPCPTSSRIIMRWVDQEREGEEIDQALVKNVLDIYTEMGEGSMKYYQKDFDEAMLADTAAIYSPKASIWITSESYKDYMLKVVAEPRKDQGVTCPPWIL